MWFRFFVLICLTSLFFKQISGEVYRSSKFKPSLPRSSNRVSDGVVPSSLSQIVVELNQKLTNLTSTYNNTEQKDSDRRFTNEMSDILGLVIDILHSITLALSYGEAILTGIKLCLGAMNFLG